MSGFASLGVPPALVARLVANGIEEPFPIQAATIADALAGRDLCGKAHTGSGKTLAFAIPMVASVTRSAPKKPHGLILTPTRELALQVADEVRMISGDLRVLAVYGGARIEPQLKALRSGVDIVVACPGRLLDVIEKKACDLRSTDFVVVDEADRMADMGFLPDVRRLLDQTAPRRQTLLFSATLDDAVAALVRDYQDNPVVHELAEEPAGDITHRLWVAARQRRQTLTAEIVERVGATVVFSRTRHGADRIARQLNAAGVKAAAIHGSRSQGQRERALRDFHDRRVAALVATDVAARGIHVEGVNCVVHYDLPADHKDYVHRSGRTGRAGADGTVVALLGAAQRRDAVKLAKQVGLTVEPCDPAVLDLPLMKRSDRRESSAPERSGGRRPRREQGPTERRSSKPPPAQREAGPHRPHKPASERPRAQKAKAGGADSSRRASGDKRPRVEPKPAHSGPSPKAGRTRTNASAGNGSTPVASRRDRPGKPGGDAFERVVSGSDKVRPSGASRRKAKREAQIAAGIDPSELRKPKRRR